MLLDYIELLISNFIFLFILNSLNIKMKQIKNMISYMLTIFWRLYS